MTEISEGVLPKPDAPAKASSPGTAWRLVFAELLSILSLLGAGIAALVGIFLVLLCFGALQKNDHELSYLVQKHEPWVDALPLPSREFFAGLLIAGTVAVCVGLPRVVRGIGGFFNEWMAWTSGNRRLLVLEVLGRGVVGCAVIWFCVWWLARTIEDTLVGQGIIWVQILPQRGFISGYNWVEFAVVASLATFGVCFGFVVAKPGLEVLWVIIQAGAGAVRKLRRSR